MELNKVMLIGNLTRDPETRHTGSGKQVTNLRLAVNTRRGRDRDETLYIGVTLWERTAEIADKYLRKGSQCLIEGRLQMNEYETRDGQKRQEILVVGDRLQLGARPRDGGGDSGDGGFTREPVRNYDDNYRDSGSRDQSGGGSHGGGSSSGQSEETEDDLPF